MIAQPTHDAPVGGVGAMDTVDARDGARDGAPDGAMDSALDGSVESALDGGVDGTEEMTCRV